MNTNARSNETVLIEEAFTAITSNLWAEKHQVNILRIGGIATRRRDQGLPLNFAALDQAVELARSMKLASVAIAA